MNDGTRKGTCDSLYRLNLRHHELAELVHVAGLGPHDHVIGTGNVLSLRDTGDSGDLAGHVRSLADFGLDENIGLHHNVLPGDWISAERSPYPVMNGRCVITVGDLGEFGVIARIAGRLPQGRTVLLGPGDDAAMLSAP